MLMLDGTAYIDFGVRPDAVKRLLKGERITVYNPFTWHRGEVWKGRHGVVAGNWTLGARVVCRVVQYMGHFFLIEREKRRKHGDESGRLQAAVVQVPGHSTPLVGNADRSGPLLLAAGAGAPCGA